MSDFKHVGPLLPLPPGIEPTPIPEDDDPDGYLERRRKHLAALGQRQLDYWKAVKDGTYTGHYEPVDEPPDGLPMCATCKGFRWLRRPIESPRDAGWTSRMVPCPDCLGVVTQQRLERLGGALPAEFRDWTLETFPAEEPHRRLLAALREWLAAEAEPWIYLFSTNTGRGKTGLAIGLLKVLMARGASGMFVMETEMHARLKASFGSAESWQESGAPYLTAMRTCDVLVYDDLASTRQTDWAKDLLLDLIFHRHSEGLRTILTSNLPLDRLTDIQDHQRTAVRIKERCAHGHWVLDLSRLPDLRDAEPMVF